LYSDLFVAFLKSKSKTATGPGKRIVIGTVGYPNVGKSSTINVLVHAKKVSVSATPGKTKHFQTLLLGDNLSLCDCPGLVFPTFLNTKADLLVNGILPIDQLHTDDHISPLRVVCHRVSANQILNVYGLRFFQSSEKEKEKEKEIDKKEGPERWEAEDLLTSHAKMRGFWGNHGRPDIHRSARIILKDFVQGRLLYCHPPPQLSSHQRSEFFYSFVSDTKTTSDSTNNDNNVKTPAETGSRTSQNLTESDERTQVTEKEDVDVIPVVALREKKKQTLEKKEVHDELLEEVVDPGTSTPSGSGSRSDGKLTSRDKSRVRKQKARMNKRTLSGKDQFRNPLGTTTEVHVTGRRQAVPGGAGRVRFTTS